MSKCEHCSHVIRWSNTRQAWFASGPAGGLSRDCAASSTGNHAPADTAGTSRTDS